MTGLDDATFELVGAYLDGELTAEERAQVEELLASSDAHRRLHADLLSMRSEFQALPAPSPSDDFTQRILSAVEEAPSPAALAETFADRTSKSADRATESTNAPRSSRAKSWRRVWVQVAIAASVAVVMFAVYRLSVRAPNGGQPDVVENPLPSVPNVAENVGPQSPPTPVPPAPEVPGIPGIGPDALGAGFVFNDVKSELLLIFEYSVEDKVLDDRVFENALQMHAVQLNDALEPDANSKKAILASRVFGGDKANKIEKPNGLAENQGKVQFSVVVADVDVLFALSETLRTHPGVRGLKVDLSLHKSDINMMQELDRLRDDQFADATLGEVGRAYFVSLRDDLRSTLLGSTTALLKLDGGGPPQKMMLGGPGRRMMPVAFILRSAGK